MRKGTFRPGSGRARLGLTAKGTLMGDEPDPGPTGVPLVRSDDRALSTVSRARRTRPALRRVHAGAACDGLPGRDDELLEREQTMRQILTLVEGALAGFGS